MPVRVNRLLTLEDPIRRELYRRSPELGPKLLFFSGGTALKKMSQQLIEYTRNSIHIITPFDSGGSSARLREAFHMPAVGDIRNRLMALADRSILGNPEIFKLFAHRFPHDGTHRELTYELDRMIDGRHPMVAAISDPMRKIIRHHLWLFKKHASDNFDLTQASIGNLILTGGYLDMQRMMDPVIYIFSKLVQVYGVVRPVVTKDLHIAAELETGEVIVGQHRLTGKESPPIESKIKKLYLCKSLADPEPASAEIRKKMQSLIALAELICYPFGSFYSSLIANLLPKGVGTAVSQNPCLKVYIPNTVSDPEQYGMNPSEQIDILLSCLRKDDPTHIAPSDVLNIVIVDRKHGDYGGEWDDAALKQMGIELIDCPLISEKTHPYIDETLLIPLLLSLAS